MPCGRHSFERDKTFAQHPVAPIVLSPFDSCVVTRVIVNLYRSDFGKRVEFICDDTPRGRLMLPLFWLTR